MWRLLQPLDYLRVRHQEKELFDWLLPLFVTAILVGAWFCDGFRSALLAPNTGVVPQIQSLLSILTGFFIAALAAVATFNSNGMDEPIVGKQQVLLGRKDNDTESEVLTRRRFLCLLFGFLALEALFLYLAGVLVIALRETLDTWLVNASHDYPNLVNSVWLLAWTGYSFLLSQLMINTLLGLFYLTDRIHRPKGEHSVGKPTQSNE